MVILGQAKRKKEHYNFYYYVCCIMSTEVDSSDGTMSSSMQFFIFSPTSKNIEKKLCKDSWD